MKLLLDTHAFAWWLLEDVQMSETARSHIADPKNRIFVSAASAFEMAIKHRLGKWQSIERFLPEFASTVSSEGFEALNVTIVHAIKAGSLNGSHADPFDRLLAAQAIEEDCRLVSSDAAMRDLGVKVVW